MIKMKKKKLIPLFIFTGIIATILLFSCSSNKTENKESADTTTASNNSDLMKEEPAYDANKIDPNAPVTEITLITEGNSMTDMRYDQTEIHVKAGTTVKLKLINHATDAAMIHNFVIIEKGTADQVGPEGIKVGPDKNYVPAMKEVLVSTPLTGPGKTNEISFPAPAAGNYDFICTYPGHYKMMHGVFIVD
jgi:azurin